jgi:hypothetical protein
VRGQDQGQQVVLTIHLAGGRLDGGLDRFDGHIAASISAAELLGIDIPGNMSLAELICQEIIKILTDLKNDVFTPASDTTAATACATQITALT